jgi:BirA family transcriptional regulator, biotin operon repressor / biotin---[acetyl-CoA-carboxylase] ligase
MTGFEIHWFDELPSTNSWLRTRLVRGEALPSGTVIAARRQTAGRGRFSRAWQMEADRDLAFSLLLREEVLREWIPSLPMAAALAASEALDDYGIASRVKWPNDVLVPEGRHPGKICGILSELVSSRSAAPYQAADVHTVIAGVGMNVNMPLERVRAIDRPATSIAIETGRETPPWAVLEAVLARLPAWLAAWRGGGFAAIRDAWMARCGPMGRPVTIAEGAIRKTGLLAGFGEQGELLLRDEQGEEKVIRLGDMLA